MQPDYHEPLNLGQDRMVIIDQLADLVAAAAGMRIVKRHVRGSQGVRGRNSDNTRLREVLGWEPEVSLEDGLARTYAWIEAQVRAKLVRDSVSLKSVETPVPGKWHEAQGHPAAGFPACWTHAGLMENSGSIEDPGQANYM